MYWLTGILPGWCLIIIALLFDNFVRDSAKYPITFVTVVVLWQVPMMFLSIRRSHDLGKSGKFAFLLFFPIVQVWPIVEFAFFSDTGIYDNIKFLVSLIIALSLLTYASTHQDDIFESRVEMKLASNADLENLSPEDALIVALGAFRGIYVDYLWIQADIRKDKGQFFDALQIAKKITELQPRFAAVWEFQAWNMAYNISVAMPAEQWQERWKWVRNGYELLRDEGIKKNPHVISLYRYLAWIFQHKISYVADDCHKHYKRELALSIRPLLGFPETRAEFIKLQAQPTEFEDVAADADVAEFIAALRAVDKNFESDSDFVNNYLTLRRLPARFPEAAHKVINDFRTNVALEKFDRFARAYALRNEWKFDVRFMQELNDKFGPRSVQDPNVRKPLNWEHPDVHAIYWAELGLKLASSPGNYSVDEKNTDRIVFHSLQNLFRSGRMIIYPIPNELPSVFLRPDLEMFDSARELWKSKISKYEALEKGNPKAVRGGYKNMLTNAAYSFYLAGQKEKTIEIFKELRERFPDNSSFKLSLIDFLRERQEEEMSSIGIHDAREEIIFLLREAYFRFAVYQDDEAAGREAWAQQVYDLYQAEFGDELIKRVDLPSFDMMKFLSFMDFLSDARYEEYLKKNLIGRIQIESPELYKKLLQQEKVFNEMVQQMNDQQP